jgi:hypothetical protein
MALAGFRNPTATTGTAGWTTPDNCFTSNDADATYSGSTQQYLETEGYGFTIPTNAIVRGFEVTVEARSVGGTRTIEVALSKNGTAIVGTAKTQALTTADVIYSFGSSTDVWGSITWDNAEVNATTFGVFIRDDTASASDIEIDHVKVRVYYDNGVRGAWDVDYDNLEISHISGYMDWDAGSGGTLPADGDVIFDSTSGSTQRILGTSGSTVLAVGTATLSEQHDGTVADADSLEVCSYVDFDTEVSGGPSELDNGLAVTGGTLSGAIQRHVESDGVSGRLWYTATSGSLADTNGITIGGTLKANADGASVDNAWVGTADGAQILDLQGSIPIDTISVAIESVSGNGRIRTSDFQHNICVWNTVNNATAMVADIRVDQNDSTLATLYLSDLTGDWTSAGIDDDAIEILEELAVDTETNGGLAVGDAVEDTGNTHSWTVRRIIDRGDGTAHLYLERLTGSARFGAGAAEDVDLVAGTTRFQTIVGSPQLERVGIAAINTAAGLTATDMQWQSSHLYTDIQDQLDELLNMDDLIALSAQVQDQQYTGLNTWKIPHFSMRRLAKGAMQQRDAVGAADNDDVYTNDAHLGSLNGTPNLYVEQNGIVLEQHWDAGPMDVLLRNKVKNTLINNGERTWYARPFGDLYDFSKLTSVGLARPVPMNTSNDVNNNTTYAVVRDDASDVYQTIEVVWASHTINFDTGAGGTFHAGDVIINTTQTPDEGVMVARIPDSFVSGTDLHVGAHGQDITDWGDGDALEIANYVDFDGQAAGQAFVVGNSYEESGGAGWEFDCVWVQQFGEERGRLWYKSTSGTPTDNDNIEPNGGGTVIATVKGSEVVRAGWTGLTNTATPETADNTVLLDTGAGGENPYNVHFILNGATMTQFYEWTKFLTEERAGSTTDPNSFQYPNDTAVQGRLYQTTDSANSVSDLNKQAPFGSKAGTSFFGARGVFISDMASADVQNFSLIDSDGNPAVPPNTQTVTVSNLESGYAAAVWVRPDYTSSGLVYDDDGGAGDSDITDGTADFIDDGFVAGANVIISGTTSNNGTFPIKAVATTVLTLDGIVLTDESPASSTVRGDNVNKDQYTDGTGNNSGDGDYVVTETLDSWLPSTGTLIVTSTNGSEVSSGGYEDVYTYTSFTGSTFTISGTLVRTYSTDARAYVPFIRVTTSTDTESQNFVYSADVPVIINARKKGFIPFTSQGVVGSTGLSVAIVRTTDTIVE